MSWKAEPVPANQPMLRISDAAARPAADQRGTEVVARGLRREARPERVARYPGHQVQVIREVFPRPAEMDLLVMVPSSAERLARMGPMTRSGTRMV